MPNDTGQSATLDAVLKHDILEIAEERALARRASKGDIAARDKLLTQNAKLVQKEALSFTKRYWDVPDYFSAGIIGLHRAIRYFDATRAGKSNCRFSTFARTHIRRQMQTLRISFRCPVAIIPENKYRIQSAARAKKSENPNASTAEIAAELNVPVGKLATLLELANYTNIDAPVGDGFDNLHELIASGDLDAAAIVESADKTETIHRAVAELRPIERDVLFSRFGLGGADVETLESIASRLKKTRERVRQIEARALRTLRERFARTTSPYSELAT